MRRTLGRAGSVYNGTKPSWFRHSSASEAAQMISRSSITAPTSKLLRNNNDAGARITFKETCQMSGHRFSIVRDQNSPGLGGESQHSSIRSANHETVARVAEVNRCLSSAQAK